MIGRGRIYLSGAGLGPLLVKAIAGSAVVRIAGTAFGFLVGVQLARGLGVEAYGIYGIAMAAIVLLGVPSEFGLPQLLSREVAAGHYRGDSIRLHSLRGWALRIVLVSSGLIVVSLLVWTSWAGAILTPGVQLPLLVGAAMIPFVAMANLNGAVMRGMQQLVRGQLPDGLIRPLAFSCILAIWVLIFDALSPATAMLLSVASVVLTWLFSAAMLRSLLPSGRATCLQPLSDKKELLQAAIPMALTEGLRIMQAQLAILLLGFLTTVATVGLFRVAASVAVFIAMPISLFNITGGPVIARLHTAGDRARLQRLLAWFSVGMFAGTLLISLPFFLAGDWLLDKVFGSDFASASTILHVLCVGVILNGIFGANAILLNMTGHERAVTRASMLSVFTLVVLLPLGVWIADGVGAAWAATAALTTWNVVMWWEVRRRLGLEPTFIALFHGSLKRG